MGGRAAVDGCRSSPSPQRFKGTDGAEKAAEKAKPAKVEEAKGKAAKPEEAVEEVGAAPPTSRCLGDRVRQLN